ncbi:MAG: DUF3298 and DUF4163 domain-containing protein [Firmicutes bacterium]|nr:DUF3298 and DUF4163 domain-containing protein [Bacillota bacterium]
MRRLLILGMAVICLCGCDMRGVRADIETKEYETDFSAVRAEVIRFSGMRNAEFEESINSSIEQAVESDLIAFDSLALDSGDNVRMGNKCVLEIDWDEKYNRNDFISVVEEKYVYTGGAHGNTVRIPKNIDLSAEKEITLADLFEDEGYTDTLNRFINEILSENSEEYKDLWAKPEIKDSHQTDFYISDDDLVIFFQPYDLSYYARGFVEFPIELEELSGYMKEEYRRLLK